MEQALFLYSRAEYALPPCAKTVTGVERLDGDVRRFGRIHLCSVSDRGRTFDKRTPIIQFSLGGLCCDIGGPFGLPSAATRSPRLHPHGLPVEAAAPPNRSFASRCHRLLRRQSALAECGGARAIAPTIPRHRDGYVTARPVPRPAVANRASLHPNFVPIHGAEALREWVRWWNDAVHTSEHMTVDWSPLERLQWYSAYARHKSLLDPTSPATRKTLPTMAHAPSIPTFSLYLPGGCVALRERLREWTRQRWAVAALRSRGGSRS